MRSWGPSAAVVVLADYGLIPPLANALIYGGTAFAVFYLVNRRRVAHEPKDEEL